MPKGLIQKNTFAEIEQECVLSNFELKFDFLERLKLTSTRKQQQSQRR